MIYYIFQIVISNSMTLTKEFIDHYETVDINKEYTKNELCIILNTVYKEIYSKNNNKKRKKTTY